MRQSSPLLTSTGTLFGVLAFVAAECAHSSICSACIPKPEDSQLNGAGKGEHGEGSDVGVSEPEGEPSSPIGHFVSFRIDGPYSKKSNSPWAIGADYSFGYWVANSDFFLISAGIGPGLNFRAPVVPLLEFPLRATFMTPGPASLSLEFAPTIARYHGQTYALGSVGVYYAILYVADFGFSAQIPMSPSGREDWMRDVSLGLHIHVPLCMSRGRFRVRWGCL